MAKKRIRVCVEIDLDINVDDRDILWVQHAVAAEKAYAQNDLDWFTKAGVDRRVEWKVTDTFIV